MTTSSIPGRLPRHPHLHVFACSVVLFTFGIIALSFTSANRPSLITALRWLVAALPPKDLTSHSKAVQRRQSILNQRFSSFSLTFRITLIIAHVQPARIQGSSSVRLLLSLGIAFLPPLPPPQQSTDHCWTWRSKPEAREKWCSAIRVKMNGIETHMA